MAKIIVTFSKLEHYVNAVSREVTEADISLATDKVGCDVFLFVNNENYDILPYSMSILDFSFQKKMYQPTEFNVTLGIAAAEGTAYTDIPRTQLENLFKHIRVSIKDADSDFYEGKEFFVHEVMPLYSKDAVMQVTLKIYSLDKLLTLNETSRTFVRKKLDEDILNTEIKKYMKPWTVVNTEKIDAGISQRKKKLKENDELKKYHKVDEKMDIKELTEQEINTLKNEIADLMTLKKVSEEPEVPMSYTAANMRILRYKKDKEHIFPYLVQYNESFYDFLARTTNRWGEFMFYEDDKLNIGYNAAANPIQVAKKDIVSISYFNINSKKLRLATDGAYNYEADNSSLTGKPLQKSPVIVKAQMGDFGGKADKWIMKQFANVFKNDKNLPTMLTNLLFDNLFNLAMAESSVAKLNSDFDEKYFADYDTNNVQYGQHNFAKPGEATKELNAFQQFTELHTEFDGKKYMTILAKEQTVGQNAIFINYGTTYPKLKLGDIITFNQENFIVVEVNAHIAQQTIKNDKVRNLVFEVIATAQDSSDKLFYPAVIPAGHVRYANPQPATITDAKDPGSKNRVRVMFSWQTIKYEGEDDTDKTKPITEETKSLSTPWLNFASNQNGYPTMGYHYEKNPVMVGFEGGNVERPYVMGGLADDFMLADSVLASQGMHQLTLTDGLGAGMQAFLAGCLSPLTKVFMGFCPGKIPSWKWDKDKYFEGGFELTDYYGIYKISGSTDGRNVSIASNWGDVKINAFTGINISAPNGDVKISGKNVTIEAGNNLKLVSGTNVNYKLWKSKDTGLGTAAQMLLDVTAQVTKKIAQMALGVVDLSLVRSTVEIFFRPVEGTLTVKSNRFLKLEAGNSSCAFPASAYNREKKIKLLDEMNKNAIKGSAGIGDGMVEMFLAIHEIVMQIFQKYGNLHKESVALLRSIENALEAFKEYSNDPTKDVCKFATLKDSLWTQEKDEEWKEDKLEFADDVEVNGEAQNIVTDQCCIRLFHYPASNTDPLMIQSFKETIVETRKNNRKMILKDINQLRKKIYLLTHLEPVKTDVDKLFGHHFYKAMPKDYKKKFLTAISKNKCPKAYIYDIPEDDKKLEAEKTIPLFNMMYFQRLVAMNLLDEFGFTDNMRKAIGGNPNPNKPVPPAVPDKPKVDTIDAKTPGNIMHYETWNDYVDSLSAFPPIGIGTSGLGAALLGALKSALKEKKDQLDLSTTFKERKLWSEGKNGQILFGSGNTTYAIDGNNFKPIATLESTIKTSKDLDDEEQNALQGFVQKIQNTLKKF